jgi:anti-sigma factor RsiW
MSDHLSDAILNALADGELGSGELATVTAHLQECPMCTSHALEKSLLKTATTKTGLRYTLPEDVRRRMERSVSLLHPADEIARNTVLGVRSRGGPATLLTEWMGWVVAAVLLLSAGGAALMEVRERRTQIAAVQNTALWTEMRDQHVATLAAAVPPQVLSSDRHTVKPWFQGKIPFSFNLPERLPEDVKLEGANLTYLHGRPVAQLIYSIGKHHASVFVQERSSEKIPLPLKTESSGYGMTSFTANGIEVVAVSDVDPARLAELMDLIKQAQ